MKKEKAVKVCCWICNTCDKVLKGSLVVVAGSYIVGKITSIIWDHAENKKH